jgi:hypothetical protein
MNEHRDFLFVAWLTALRRTVRIGQNTRVAIDGCFVASCSECNQRIVLKVSALEMATADLRPKVSTE